MKDLQYHLKTFPRSKSIRLIMHSDGKLVVTAPKWVSKRQIEKFVEERSEWIERSRAKLKALPARPKRDTRKEYLQYKEQALSLVMHLLEHFNRHYGFSYKRVAIRNQKTRWGSCSRSGNLNFNYKLALLPPRLADYIIVHELCHLKEMNHSARFWKLVEETILDHEQRRRALRRFDSVPSLD